MNTQQLTNHDPLQRYYRFHSRIYDATRWSFLFGRKQIINLVAKEINPQSILEVGCGTGSNLMLLSEKFPKAAITGVDLSEHMLDVSRKKIRDNKPVLLLQEKYNAPLRDKEEDIIKYDLILFSYALSMFNPGWGSALAAASKQLSDNGVIAVVDFHHSRFKSFREWMSVNHVRMENHLLPGLEAYFEPVQSKIKSAYFGSWQYLHFIGRNKR